MLTPMKNKKHQITLFRVKLRKFQAKLLFKFFSRAIFNILFQLVLETQLLFLWIDMMDLKIDCGDKYWANVTAKTIAMN